MKQNLKSKNNIYHGLTCLSFLGGKNSNCPDHSLRTTFEKLEASSPLKPRGLVLLRSARYRPDMK